jgi:hypothetical protein
MNYTKFAADIDTRIQKRAADRAAVLEKIQKAQAAAADAEALKEQAALQEDNAAIDAYTEAQKKADRAAAGLAVYGKKLEALPEKVFSYDEVMEAREKLSEAYAAEQADIEKAARPLLLKLQAQLKAQAEKFAADRQTGDAAIDRMKANSETMWKGTDRRLDNDHGYYNADQDNMQKLLTVLDAILNGTQYVKVEF